MDQPWENQLAWGGGGGAQIATGSPAPPGSTVCALSCGAKLSVPPLSLVVVIVV